MTQVIIPELARAHTPHAGLYSYAFAAYALQSAWTWLVRVANTKATIATVIATAVRFLANPSLFSTVQSPLQLAKVVKVQIRPFLC